MGTLEINQTLINTWISLWEGQISAKLKNLSATQNATQHGVASKQECCRRCYESSECVVAAWHEPSAPQPENCYLHYTAAGAGDGQRDVVGCVTKRGN